MAYEGSLTETPFAEVLQHIGRSADTGILTLQGAEEIVGVTFLDGEVVSVDAVNQPPEDGLGQVLDDSNLVPLDDFASLVAENRAGGGRVIDLLLERDYVTRDQLLSALREQTLRLCESASNWETGHFRFYRGDQVSYEQGIEPLSVDDLLNRLAGHRDVAPESEAAAAATGPRIAPTPVPEVEIVELDPPAGAPAPVEPLPVEPLHGDLPQVELPPVEMPDTGYSEAGYSEAGYADLEYARLDYPEIEYPDPVEPPGETMPKVEESPKRRDWGGWISSAKAPVMPGRLLALGLLVSLIGLVLWAPGLFLLPLEGQERIRSGISRGVSNSVYTRLGRALRAHFLLEGRFPATLDRLVERGLLAESDVELAGDRLEFRPARLSYQLASEASGGERMVETEAIAGNFLLDPEFSPAEVLDQPPLLLLD